MCPWNSIRVESPSWWVPSSPIISDQGEAIGMPLRASDGLRAYNLLPAIFDIQVRKHEAKNQLSNPQKRGYRRTGSVAEVGEKVNKVAVSFLKVVTQKGGC